MAQTRREGCIMKLSPGVRATQDFRAGNQGGNKSTNIVAYRRIKCHPASFCLNEHDCPVPEARLNIFTRMTAADTQTRKLETHIVEEFDNLADRAALDGGIRHPQSRQSPSSLELP
jgi:hypothetical protein